MRTNSKTRTQELPPWARQQFNAALQELEAQGMDYRTAVDVSTMQDIVSQAMPRTMSWGQYERDVNPAVAEQCRRYGIK